MKILCKFFGHKAEIGKQAELKGDEVIATCPYCGEKYVLAKIKEDETSIQETTEKQLSLLKETFKGVVLTVFTKDGPIDIPLPDRKAAISVLKNSKPQYKIVIREDGSLCISDYAPMKFQIQTAQHLEMTPFYSWKDEQKKEKPLEKLKETEIPVIEPLGEGQGSVH